MTKDEFVAQLERGAQTSAALPVTSALLRTLAAELKKGEPDWWKQAAKAWEKRSFAAWTEAWGLFLTALHYDVLSDAEHPLFGYFPSCGGSDEVDPGPALLKALRELPKSFYEQLRLRHRRTFVEARAPLWMGPATMYFQTRRLPYYLVEANAGAGLNLAADLITPIKGFNSEFIAARIGLDPMPLDLSDPEHRRWLTAAIMPDQMQLIAPLDKAIGIVQQRMAKEAAFIQLVPCEARVAPKFVAKNIPADDKDVGLLMFNMGATVRMSDAEYEAYKKEMAAMLAPWEDRGLWLEVENVRGELYSTTYQLRAHRVMKGVLASQVLASFDFGANKTSADEAAFKAFLTVAPAPKK